MRFLKILFGSLLFIIVFVALWQNIPSILDKDITFRLDLYWIRWESTPIPIYLITPLCFLAGLVLMGLVDVGTIFRLRRKVKKLERQLALVSPPSTGSLTYGSHSASSNDSDRSMDVSNGDSRHDAMS